VADRSSQLIVGALSQCLSQAESVPLHASRSRTGLFPTSAAGKAAALRCQQEGWLSPDDHGCLITEKGIRHLLGQISPRQVLEDLVRVLETRQDEVTKLLATAQRMQASLEGLRANAERVLAHIDAPSTADEIAETLPANLSQLFRHFQNQQDVSSGVEAIDLPLTIHDALVGCPAGAGEDCPLPALYRHLAEMVPDLTIGHFHDALRLLWTEERIDLQPWTGPMPSLPEPPFALLVGRFVAYYACVRRTS